MTLKRLICRLFGHRQIELYSEGDEVNTVLVFHCSYCELTRCFPLPEFTDQEIQAWDFDNADTWCDKAGEET